MRKQSTNASSDNYLTLFSSNLEKEENKKRTTNVTHLPSLQFNNGMRSSGNKG